MPRRSLCLLVVVALAGSLTACDWLGGGEGSSTAVTKVTVPERYTALRARVEEMADLMLEDDAEDVLEDMSTKQLQEKVPEIVFVARYALARGSAVKQAYTIEEIAFSDDGSQAEVIIRWLVKLSPGMGGGFNVNFNLIEDMSDLWTLEEGEWRLDLVPEHYITQISGVEVNLLER